MKAWHKVTHWRWRSSKSSKSKTQPSEEPAQTEETPVQAAHSTRILLEDGHEKGSNTFSKFGQAPAYGNHEEEKTTVDPSHRAYGAKEFVSEEECGGEDCPHVRLLRKQESLRTGDQEEIQTFRANLLQQKHDLKRNEKMAVARLKAVEDEKDALEVALGAERANTATQLKAMHTLRGKNVEAQSVEMELRNQVEALKQEKSQAEELRATLQQLKHDLQRNEKMAVARLKAVEDEKAALEVALGAERAITAMQQEKMSQAEDEGRATSLQLKDELQRNESELCATLLQLKHDLQRNEEMTVARLKAVTDEKAALEEALGAERANTVMQQKTIYTLRGESIEAQSVEVELRNQVEMLKEKMSQEAEIGRRQTKEEKIRSGVARLIEKDLRKQVATLEQSRMQQADEIRRLLTQVLQQNEERHIDSVVTFGRTQGSNATASALGDDHPDCSRLHADFYPGWEAPVGVAIVGIFRITVPPSIRDKHLGYVRSHGNLVQRFHGTSCRSACNFILDPKKAAPCGLQDCNVCNICLQGFKIGKSSTRYGRGVYFSKQATKANSYAGGSEKKENGKKLRCIFVADVAKGRDFVTKKTGFDGARYPPVGHDSVQGEVGNGLDFEELVVYHEEAAIPTHLIVYTVP
ncbi:unnamed protein product [Ectocarpus sp. 12 AP-2014]